MLTIEKNINNDETGAYKDELLNKFTQAATEVRAEMSSGVSPEEYQRLDRFLNALTISCETVESTWASRPAATA